MTELGNILAPAGAQAAVIAAETWYLLAVIATVYVIVVAALVAAVLRHMRRGRDRAPSSERRITIVVASALLLTTVVLSANLLVDMGAAHAVGHLTRDDALTIRVTGQQWWWQVDYLDPTPSKSLTTANEIHIPTGEPILLELRTADVIHSFWVPQLHGKRDLMPGFSNNLWIQADEPGIYRGQCAEFCGHQHAHMGVVVVAEPRAEFDRWYEAQLAPSALPQQSLESEGRDVLLAKSCPLCHTVRGTPAGGRVAPDLTHVASRQTIGAGTLPNVDDALQRWIADPHMFKPGVKMPQNPLTERELRALAAYVRSLR